MSAPLTPRRAGVKGVIHPSRPMLTPRRGEERKRPNEWPLSRGNNYLLHLKGIRGRRFFLDWRFEIRN